MIRIDAVKAVAYNLRDLIADTIPASLAASHVDVAKLVHPITDELKGRDFYIYSGAGVGQQRTVTGFTPANNRLTFDQVFASMPSINSNFLVLDFFSKDEYDYALDRMIGAAKMRYLQEMVATIEIIGTQYEYAVPSGMEFINTFRLVPTGASDYGSDDEVSLGFELPPRYWRVEANPLGSFIVAFDRRKVDLDNYDEQWVRIMGQAKPNVAATDNATIPAEIEEYVVSGATRDMALSRIDEGKRWQTLYYNYRDMNREQEAYIFTARRGKEVG